MRRAGALLQAAHDLLQQQHPALRSNPGGLAWLNNAATAFMTSSMCYELSGPRVLTAGLCSAAHLHQLQAQQSGTTTQQLQQQQHHHNPKQMKQQPCFPQLPWQWQQTRHATGGQRGRAARPQRSDALPKSPSSGSQVQLLGRNPALCLPLEALRLPVPAAGGDPFQEKDPLEVLPVQVRSLGPPHIRPLLHTPRRLRSCCMQQQRQQTCF
jgi:hypothetical protein